MASQSRQSKVLRIGIIQDGKIVQERLIKENDPVSVGESAKNTFVFPKTHLPTAEFPLFQATSGGYRLQFTDQMKGKISSGGAVVALQKLAKDPSVKKQGDLYTIELTFQDRGKITIDAITVLFQFVTPPPVKAVKPMEAMDFRPRFIEDDDPVFLGFLAVWSALAVVLSIWVINSEKPEYTLEEIPDRFAKIMRPEKEEPPPVEELEIDNGLEIEQQVETKPEPSNEKQEKPKNAADEAARKEKLKEDVAQKNKLLAKIIGTTGESSGGVVSNLWSDEDQGLGDIDAALADAGGITTDAGEALKSGKGGRGEASDIGSLGGLGGGSSDIGSGPEIKAKVSAGSGSVDDISGDKAKFKSTVSRYAGQLQYCYESRLKVVPDLEGRVEIGWSVEGGKVIQVLVVSNSTGDAALADCIQKKIKRWTFPADTSGETSYPFVFTAK